MHVPLGTPVRCPAGCVSSASSRFILSVRQEDILPFAQPTNVVDESQRNYSNGLETPKLPHTPRECMKSEKRSTDTLQGRFMYCFHSALSTFHSAFKPKRFQAQEISCMSYHHYDYKDSVIYCRNAQGIDYLFVPQDTFVKLAMFCLCVSVSRRHLAGIVGLAGFESEAPSPYG